jgi:hypothetical protein
MLILSLLALAAAVVLLVMYGIRKIGLVVVLVALAVAMYWHDNFSFWDWVIFTVIMVAGLAYTFQGNYFHGGRLGAGLGVLLVTVVLATTWDISPDFDTMAAQAVTTTVPVTVTVIPATTDADGNTEDVPIVQPTEADDTVTDQSSTEDPAIPPTVECDDGGTFAEMVACINKSTNKDEIVAFLNANEIGILGNDEAGTTWERLEAYPADLDSRVILVLNAPDVTDAEARAVAAKSMGELAERAKIVRRDGVVLFNSYTDPATGEVKAYADARRQVRVITTYAVTGKEALKLAYNGQGMLNGCLNGAKGIIIKEEVHVETRVETRTITTTQTVNSTSSATVSAPAVTQTATSTSTASGPAVTTTVTATTSPTPGKTATITLPVESRTTTATATASAEPGPTVTVVGPGATATVTSTATATVPGPATTVTATATVPGPGVTVTSSGGSTATVPGPTVTVTSTSTVTAPPLPGKTATITLPVETRTNTVTQPAEPGPTVTHTITVTAQPEQTGDPVDP